MPSDNLTIGDLSRATGCNAQTIRYYEKIGLMPLPQRTAGKQRRYEPKHLSLLAFIRHARMLGFPLEAIRELLELAAHPEQPCAGADSLARAQLRDVEDRIDRLKGLRRELKRMVDECDGKRVEHCRIIEVLADHGQCLDEHAPPP
jgi:DNA-binding transcriptional MerR regulator